MERFNAVAVTIVLLTTAFMVKVSHKTMQCVQIYVMPPWMYMKSRKYNISIYSHIMR